MNTKIKATILAILAAGLYAINVPFSKVLLSNIAPAMLASFLYLGAGVGLLIYAAIKKLCGVKSTSEPLTKKELPYTLAMIGLDIIAPILLMLGITKTASANVSLLNNFEIVATTLIALVIFKEAVSKKLWVAIGLVTVASIVLGFEGAESFSFNEGSLYVLGACLSWGFENNCTRKLSGKSSTEITTIKGCFSGLGSLIVAFAMGEGLPIWTDMFFAMLLGFVAYGLSIKLYIMAQKDLGAAKTSAFYSVAPFLGVLFSFIVLNESLGVQFYIGLVIMLVATLIMIKDTVESGEKHE